MKDRTPRYPGRVVMTPVAGQANTYDMTRADSPIEAGTPLNKQTLLTDETAYLLELKKDNPTPDDAFAHIAKNFGADGGTNINLLEEAIHMKYCKVLSLDEPAADVEAFYAGSIVQTGYESDDGYIQALACIERTVSTQLKIRIINKRTGKVFNSTVPLYADVYKYALKNNTQPGSGLYANFNGWFHFTPVKNKSNEVMLKLCGDLVRGGVDANNSATYYSSKMRMVRIIDVTTGTMKAYAYAGYSDTSSGVVMSSFFPLGVGNNDYCYYNSTYDYYYTPLVRSLGSSSYNAASLFYIKTGTNLYWNSSSAFSSSPNVGFATSGTTHNGYMGATYYSSTDYSGRCFSWYMPISNTTGLSFLYDSYSNVALVYSVSQTAYATFSKTTLYNGSSFYGFSNATWCGTPGNDYGLRTYVLATSDNRFYIFAGGVQHSSHSGYSTSAYYCLMRFGPFSLSSSSSNPPTATVVRGLPQSGTTGFTDYRMFNIIGCLDGNPDKPVYAIVPFNNSVVGGYGGTVSTVAIDKSGNGYFLMLPSVMAGQNRIANTTKSESVRYDGDNNPWASGYTLPTCWYNNHLTKMFSCDIRRRVFLGNFASQQIKDSTGVWECPEDGTYKIIMVGGGAAGGALTGGGSGYLRIATRFCTKGERITYHIGRGGTSDRGTSNPYSVDPPSSMTWFETEENFALGGACSIGGGNGYPSGEGGGGGGYDLVNYGGNGQLSSIAPQRNGGQGSMPAIGYGAGGCAGCDGADGVIVIVR